MGYSLTHRVLETLCAATAEVFSGWHFSCSPWARYQGKARPNYTLLNMHLHTVLYCAREAYPWMTPSPSTDIWQLLMQQTQHSGEEVIISPVVQRGGDEMQKSNCFSQVADRKCVSVTAEFHELWLWIRRDLDMKTQVKFLLHPCLVLKALLGLYQRVSLKKNLWAFTFLWLLLGRKRVVETLLMLYPGPSYPQNCHGLLRILLDRNNQATICFSR